MVIAIVAILAALLFPSGWRRHARAHARASAASTSRQIGQAFWLYLQDYDERMPDRRALELALGYRPWSGDPSDPRCGWAGLVLEPYMRDWAIWSCLSVAGSRLGEVVSVVQSIDPTRRTRYWMWRFDRVDDPVPPDNFWGKTPEQAVADLQANSSPLLRTPRRRQRCGTRRRPLLPAAIPTVAPELRGPAVHRGGRNRLFLDGHIRWLRDVRTGAEGLTLNRLLESDG